MSDKISNDDEDIAAVQAMERALPTILPDDMCTRWVFLGEVINKETGEKTLWRLTSPDLRSWESVGFFQDALNDETGWAAARMLRRYDEEN